MTEPIETLAHVEALVRSCGSRLTAVRSSGYWGVTLYGHDERELEVMGTGPTLLAAFESLIDEVALAVAHETEATGWPCAVDGHMLRADGACITCGMRS